MPDVGVLNLTIQDNSEKASQGLRQLVGALEAVKQAVSGSLGLSTVSNQLKKLTETISQNINQDVITKLNEFGDAMSKLNGLGNININIRGADRVARAVESITTGREQMTELGNAAENTVQQMSEGFASAERTIDTVTESVGEMQQAVNHKGFNLNELFDPSQLRLGDLGKDMNSFTKETQQYGDMVRDSFEKIRDMGALDDVTRRVEESTESVREEREVIAEAAKTAEAVPKVTVFSSIEEAAKSMGITVEEVTKKMKEDLASIGIASPKNIRVFNSIEEAAKRTGRSVYSITKEMGENLERIGVLNPGEAVSRRMEKQQEARIAAAQRYFSDATPKMQQEIAELIGSDAPNVFHMVAEGAKEAQNPVNGVSAAVKDAQKNIKNLTDTEDENKKKTSALSATFKSLGRTIGNIGVVRLLGQFTRIARYRAIRAVLRQITQGVTEGLSNFKKYSEAIGGTYYNNMQDLSAQLLTMKNSIGASIAPVIQAALPVIKTLTNYAIEAFNAVNQLFSILAGKSSWTRATAATVDTLDAVKNAAGGAGGAVKDMLADFDELNVLDHSGGGGGGGGSSSDLSAYENMFEEVFDFDSRIKDTIGWLEDHLPVVNGLVAMLASLLLGLPGMVTVGIGILVTGISMMGEAGYDIGRNGLSGKNILETIGGAVVSALGGAVLGWRLLRGTAIGGAGGAFLGMTLGVAVGLVIWTIRMEQGFRDSQFGDLHASYEEIYDYVKDYYHIQVSPQIDIVKAKITGIRDLRRQVQDEIEKVNTSLKIAISSNATLMDAAELANDVKDLVSLTQSLIQEKKEFSIYIRTILNPDIEVEDIDGLDGWDILSGIVGDLGTQIGNILADNVIDEFEKETLTKLMGSLTRISAAISGSKNAEAYTSASFNYRDAFINGQFDRESFNNYVTAIESLNEDTWDTAIDLVNMEAENWASQIAGLEAALAEGYTEWNGMNIEEALEEARAQYANLDTPEKRKAEARKYYETWTGPEIGRQREDLLSGYDAVYGNKSNVTLAELRDSLRTHANRADLREGRQDINDLINEAVAHITGQDVKVIIKAEDMFEITGWDLLSKDLKQQVVTVLHHNVGLGVDEAVKLLKDRYNLSMLDVINIFDWDSMEDGKAKAYMTMVMGIFDESEAEFRKAMHESQHETQRIIDGYEFTLPEIDASKFEESMENIGDFAIASAHNTAEIVQKELKDPDYTIGNVTLPSNYGNFAIISAKNTAILIQQELQRPRYIIGDAMVPYNFGTSAMSAAANLALIIQQTVSQENTTGNVVTPPAFGQTAIGDADVFQKNMQFKVGQPLTTSDAKTPTAFGKEALQTVMSLYNSMKSAVSDTIMITVGLQVEQAAVNAMMTGIGNIGKIILSKESFKASGAYDIPTGDLFVANEAGPELVGSMNGKTTVANQDQIIAGITRGVADGQADQNALLREQNALLRQILQKENSVRIGASAALGRTVKQSVEMYEMVGG